MAVPLVSRITGVNSIENSTCGPATTRAVGSGLATARYCATNSPNTIDTEVAISSASASASPSATSRVIDIAVNAGCSRRASSGSARYPVISVVIEMPTWAPDSWNDSVRCARCTNLSRRPPVRALASTVLRSSAVNENSAATNSAVPAVRTTKPSNASRVKTRLIDVLAGRSPGRCARPARGGLGVGRLIETGRSVRKPAASTGACGTCSLSLVRVMKALW